ncbi:MULE domain-containing protein [Aphis craccivora]|uniref:MULE domain-containing protein n=1 Tax=Aphis craccivora TaxID=307492 RepID=A0A6G0VXL5_APHCR|nr:MULE domain-containing protein [Aphis craccivora]
MILNLIDLRSISILLYKNSKFGDFTWLDKFTVSYELVDKCVNMNLLFYPKTSIHNAVLNIWPETKLECCRFHFTQADDTSEVGKWLRYVFGLLFMDPNEVGKIYVFTLVAIMPPENEKLVTFVSYLVSMYIDNDALYPQTIIHPSLFKKVFPNFFKICINLNVEKSSLSNALFSTDTFKLCANPRAKKGADPKF